MPAPEPAPPETLKLCDCAGCGRELLAAAYGAQGRRWGYELTAGRMNGRPYCFSCLHPPIPRSGRTTDEAVRPEPR